MPKSSKYLLSRTGMLRPYIKDPIRNDFIAINNLNPSSQYFAAQPTLTGSVQALVSEDFTGRLYIAANLYLSPVHIAERNLRTKLILEALLVQGLISSRAHTGR